MSPFIADTFNRTPPEHVPDLSQPSVAGLAYMLRHKETWPQSFGPWDFTRPQTCAMGLCMHKWERYLVAMDIFDKARYAGTFSLGTYDRMDPTPEEVADHLEHATATE